MTFTKAFKDVFSEYLTQYGFEWCSKVRRFVKVQNQELIFFIGYRGAPASTRSNKCFEVYVGIFSVYFSRFGDWENEYSRESLMKMAFAVSEEPLMDFTNPYMYVMGFEYDKYNNDNMTEVLRKAAAATVKWVIPEFDKVTDLKAYVVFTKKHLLIPLGFCDNFLQDSLTLILTDNHDDFLDNIDEQPESEKEFVRQCIKENYTDPRDRVFNDPILLKEALMEAEHSKKINLEALKNLKIKV
jgi:hypothetical protein